MAQGNPTDTDLVDYLQALITGPTSTSIYDLGARIDGEIINSDSEIVREALVVLAHEDGHVFPPPKPAPEPGDAADLAFLAEDHGRLQWAFMLVDDGKAKSVRDAVAMMRKLEAAK